MPMPGKMAMLAATSSDPANVPPHPLLALLDEDRQKQFELLKPEEQHAFYGQVIASVLSSPEYLKLAFDTAAREFDQIAAERAKK